MCHDVRIVEINGVKYAQYIDYLGDIEMQIRLPQEEDKLEVVEEPILVKQTRKRTD